MCSSDLCGILYLIFFIRDIFKRSSDNLKSYHSFFVFLSILSIIYISLMISLRWYLSGHIPMSNGFETMQFLAWCILIISLLLSSQQRFIFIAGFLLSGFILLVAFISERSPQITPLMPVLSSPLLCFHVSLIMLSYSLLAIIMINSVFAIIINILNIGMNSFYYLNKLFILNKILLYPALLFLGTT